MKLDIWIDGVWSPSNKTHDDVANFIYFFYSISISIMDKNNALSDQ
jgi:hypothetical protein